MTTQNADLATLDTIDYNGANVTQVIKDGATIWLKQNGIVYWIGKTIWVNGVSSVISSIDGTVVYYTQADGTTGSFDSTSPTGVTETDPNAGNNNGGGGGPDQDGDGIPDATDTDMDNDGLPDNLGFFDPYPGVFMSLSGDLQTGTSGLANQVITSPDYGQHDTTIYANKRYLAPVFIDNTSNPNAGIHEFRIALDSTPIEFPNDSNPENWGTHKWYYIEIFGWIPGSTSFPEWLDVRLNRASDPYDTVQPVKWYGSTLSGDDVKNNNWNNSALLSTDPTYFPTYLNPGQLGDWNGMAGTGLRLIAYTGEMTGAPEELRLRLNSVQTFGSQSQTNPQPVIRNIQVKMIDSALASGPSVPSPQPLGSESANWSRSQTGGVQWGGIGNNGGVAYTPGDSFVSDMTGDHIMRIGNEYFVSYTNTPTEYYRSRLVRMTGWPSFDTTGSISSPTLYFTIQGGTKDGDSIIVPYPGSGNFFGTQISSQGVNDAPVLPAGGTLMN